MAARAKAAMSASVTVPPDVPRYNGNDNSAVEECEAGFQQLMCCVEWEECFGGGEVFAHR